MTDATDQVIPQDREITVIVEKADSCAANKRSVRDDVVFKDRTVGVE